MESQDFEFQPFERIHALGPGVQAGISILSADGSHYPYPTFGNDRAHGADLIHRSVRALSHFTGVDKGALQTVRQVHGNDVMCLRKTDAQSSISETMADAMITNNAALVLGIKIADCCAILMHDPIQHVIAACHSGWRGTAACIIGRTVEAMRREFGTDPSSILAWLSPCASGRNYQVGADVARLFPRSSVPLTHETWLFDNAAEIARQLQETGVQHVCVDGRCSIEDHRFHSHRRMGAEAGRTMAFVAMSGDCNPTGTEVV